MPLPPNEPLEAVLAKLEAVYDRASADDAPETGTTNGHTRPDPDSSMLPLLVAICLVPHNEPEDFATLFRYFADKSRHSSSINLPKLVNRLRVALFKAVPLVGVPRIINALGALYEAVNAHPRAKEIADALPEESTKPTKTTEEDSAAGWAFFKAIYAQHAEKIIERIGKTSPDLAEMIVDELYGSNLSRTEVLSWKETVLIEFTGCAALDCPSQAKGHFYGCKNLEVDKEEVQKAIEVLREIGRWRGEPLREERIPFIQKLDKW